MPATRIAPYTLGEIARLWPDHPSSEWLAVTAPDGLEFQIKAREGFAEVWLAQPGDWAYRWAKGDEGVLTVADDSQEESVETLSGPIEG